MGSTQLPPHGTEESLAATTAAAAAPGEPVEMVQLLGPDGKLGSDPVFSDYAKRIDPEKLRVFYTDMARIRRFDQEATALQRQGELALWVPLTGQEAAQIGSGHASQAQDYIFPPTYREHGVALVRNVDLAELLKQFRGVSNGGWDPRENNFHLYTLVLAAQTLHAVATPWASKGTRSSLRPQTPQTPKLQSSLTSVTAPAPKATSTSRWSLRRLTTLRLFSSARTTIGPFPCY